MSKDPRKFLSSFMRQQNPELWRYFAIAFAWVCLFPVGCSQGLIYDLNEKTGKSLKFQNVPDGLNTLYAEDCGECHKEIFDEWSTSLHSRAYTDPFFLAYWQKDKFEWSCLTCHTPLENQIEKLVTFKEKGFTNPKVKDNPRFDKKLRREGVTCAACHVRDGIIYGPFRAKDLDAPHPVKFDPSFLSEKICLTCHQVPAKKFSFLKSAICSTGNEWTNGPYKREGFTCQSCHMPPVFRPLIEGFEKRASRRHLWKGGSKPEQVKKALTISVKKEKRRVKVDLTNSGAGHYFPTGDPDRKVFVSIDLLDSKNKKIESKMVTFERIILWKPVMIEFYDSRLPPRGTRTVFIKIPEKTDASAKIRVKAVYQILTEKARKKLEKNYGLKNYPPVRYTFFEKDYPFSELQAENQAFGKN